MNGYRLYCPMAPCLPAHDGRVTATTIAMSQSFPTHEAYWRHVERGHFLAKVNGPLPYFLPAPDEGDSPCECDFHRGMTVDQAWSTLP